MAAGIGGSAGDTGVWWRIFEQVTRPMPVATLLSEATALEGHADNAAPALLGGLTSVPGAIVGGLIIGVGEKLSAVYIGPLVVGGIDIWFASVLALLFLLVLPPGLFGAKVINRV